MSYEDFDGWDESFLDEAIRAEERALAGRSAPRTPAPDDPDLPLPAFSGPRFSPPRELSQRVSTKRPAPAFDFFPDGDFEAAQLFPPFPSTASRSVKNNGRNDVERDLGRVSQQLNQLQRELVEIRMERDRKEGQLKSALLKLEARDAELLSVKKTLKEHEASIHNLPEEPEEQRGVSHNYATTASIAGTADVESIRWNEESNLRRASCENKNFIDHCSFRENSQIEVVPTACETKCIKTTKTVEGFTALNGFPVQGAVLPEITEQLKQKKMLMRAIGVQTELFEDYNECAKDASSEMSTLSNKLLEIWGSSNSERIRGNTLLKLFATSASDMVALFRSIGTSPSIPLATGKDEFNSDKMQSVPLAELKLKQFQDSLIKVVTGISPVEAILEALLDLTYLDNDFLVYESLRTIRVIFQQMLICQPDSNSRENIIIISSSNPLSAEEKNTKCDHPTIMKSGNAENRNSRGEWKPFIKLSSSSIVSTDMQTDLVTSGCNSFTHMILIFEKMHQISHRWSQENIRVEALSIMNMILMKFDPHSKREKFGSEAIFEGLIVLLKKEAGLGVQMQAVHLLFLLLNCPSLMKKLSLDKEVLPVEEPSNHKDVLPINESFGRILDCLAGCFITCEGGRILDLKLRKRVIVLLAFMASSGKSGFELLIRHCSFKGGMSFLELIVQTLASELDAEEAVAEETHEIHKERLSVMREALILLNRLASNPAYSTSVLGLLTSSRAMANLTADVIKRFCRKNNKFEGTNRADCKETEIIDLAQVFKARFYAFLGVDIS